VSFKRSRGSLERSMRDDTFATQQFLAVKAIGDLSATFLANIAATDLASIATLSNSKKTQSQQKV